MVNCKLQTCQSLLFYPSTASHIKSSLVLKHHFPEQNSYCTLFVWFYFYWHLFYATHPHNDSRAVVCLHPSFHFPFILLRYHLTLCIFLCVCFGSIPTQQNFNNYRYGVTESCLCCLFSNLNLHSYSLTLNKSLKQTLWIYVSVSISWYLCLQSELFCLSPSVELTVYKCFYILINLSSLCLYFLSWGT